MPRAPDRPSDLPPVLSPMPRIVQVRGASGSGKTTLARRLMEELGRPTRWRQGREVIGLAFEKPVRPLFVVGDYKDGVATGGGDTLKDKELPYALAREATRQGYDVLLEGIFLSIEYWRTLYLHQDGFERYDVFIDLTVEQCTEEVHRRQEAAGKERKDLKQMADFHPRILHTRERLLAAGVPFETMPVARSRNFSPCDHDTQVRTTRDVALGQVRSLLRVS